METAIQVNNTAGARVADCAFISNRVGVDLWRTWSTTIENCTFKFCNDGIRADVSQTLFINSSWTDKSSGHGLRLVNSTAYVHSTVISSCGSGGLVSDVCHLELWNCSISSNARVGIRANQTLLTMDDTSVTGTDGIGVWNQYNMSGNEPLDMYLMRDCFLQGSTAYDLRLEGSFIARVYNTRIEPEDTRVYDGVTLEVYNPYHLKVVVEGVQPFPPQPVGYVLADQFGKVTGLGTFANDTNEQLGLGKAWTMNATDTTVHSPYNATVDVAGREWSGDVVLGFDVTSTIWVGLEVVPVIKLPERVVEGKSVVLDAASSIGYPFGLSDWTWGVEGGDTMNGSRVTTVFPSDGEYRLLLRIVDNAGNSNITTISVRVEDAPPEANIITEVPDEVDEDEVLQLVGRYVTVVDDVIIQEWDFGDGTKANGASVNHSWSKSGRYNVTFTVVEADGGQATATVAVEVVNVLPVAIIKDVDMEVGKGERFDLDGSPSLDTPSDNGSLSYLWDMGGEPFLTGAQAFWRFDRVGEYTINLMVVDDDGDWDRASMTVTVFNRPPTIEPIPDARLKATDGVWSHKLVVTDPDDEITNLTLVYPEFEPGGAFETWVERDDDRGWTIYVRPKEEKDGWRADVQVTVRDPDGGEASTTFLIEIDTSMVGEGPSLWWLVVVVVLVLVVLTLGFYWLTRRQVPPPPQGEADDVEDA